MSYMWKCGHSLFRQWESEINFQHQDTVLRLFHPSDRISVKVFYWEHTWQQPILLIKRSKDNLKEKWSWGKHFENSNCSDLNTSLQPRGYKASLQSPYSLQIFTTSLKTGPLFSYSELLDIFKAMSVFPQMYSFSHCDSGEEHFLLQKAECWEHESTDKVSIFVIYFDLIAWMEMRSNESIMTNALLFYITVHALFLKSLIMKIEDLIKFKTPVLYKASRFLFLACKPWYN